ncbi:hypothetical protein [Rhizobium laguerreae]|uniref:hypothetical protein n=1 Tax=Rhizobium laguerreae TaxID=1076926 RepID=UPI001FE9F6E9|nr:hypothetical protein [Rhizobium laguerreae]
MAEDSFVLECLRSIEEASVRPYAPALPLLLALACPAGAQEAHDAVNEANNPLTPKITINLQDYYIPSFIDTPGEPEANQFLRGLIPSDMFGLPQLLRFTLPIATSPDVPRASTSSFRSDGDIRRNSGASHA